MITVQMFESPDKVIEAECKQSRLEAPSQTYEEGEESLQSVTPFCHLLGSMSPTFYEQLLYQYIYAAFSGS